MSDTEDPPIAVERAIGAALIGKPYVAGELKIERGIPIPSRPGGTLPLAQMQIEDSILVPVGYFGRNDIDLLESWVRNRIAAFRKAGHVEWRFALKRISQGIRVWRAK